MAWCNSDSSDIEEIDIPTLVLPYQYEPLPMKATDYSSESEASRVEENVDEVDGPIVLLVRSSSWFSRH